jgi:hypothetical protein
VKIVAHRGYWQKPEEKNTLAAFRRALNHGYGIETDFRDCNGALVVSHDLPRGPLLLAIDFFSLCMSQRVSAPHAINVKVDGLHNLLGQQLKKFQRGEYFVFDMSIPDTLGYLQGGFPVFLRCSEYEVPCDALLNNAVGVWMDSFERDWVEPELIARYLEQGKGVCVVSPELHRRPHQSLWARLRAWGFHQNEAAILCTDFPGEAEKFFHD